MSDGLDAARAPDAGTEDGMDAGGPDADRVAPDASPRGDAADAAPALPSGPAYYVTLSGNPDNDGRSEESAWSLAHGFANVPSGATLWVKAGNYGAQSLVLSASGVHVKGYRASINDVHSDRYSTVAVDAPIDATSMPTIDMGDPGTEQTAISNAGADNTIENFIITNGNRGIVNRATGVGAVFRNLVIVEMGSDGVANDSSQPYEGFGLVTYAQAVVENSIFKNIGAHSCQAFGEGASGTVFRYNDLVSADFLQATDYGFLINSDTDVDAPPIRDVRVSYNRIVRADGLWHGMHGIVFKYNVENSVADHNDLVGTAIEFSMPGSRFNVAEDNTLVHFDNGPGAWHARVLFYNGPRNNVVRRNVFRTLWQAIVFASNGEDLIGYGDTSNTGFHDNRIENNIAADVTGFIYSNANLDGANHLGDREVHGLVVRNNTVLDAGGFMSWEFRVVDPVIENNVLDEVPVQRSLSEDAVNNTRGSIVNPAFANNVYVGEHNAYYDAGFPRIDNARWVDRSAIPEGLVPAAGSPLIDPEESAGAADDFEGSAPSGSRDIGAYEAR
ncbi:MAG: hypothetical protein AAGE52_37365 [Myxococcota bacterium]